MVPLSARATIIRGGLPWKPGSADPPIAVIPGSWHYFTPQEAKTVEAFVDRLIPPDRETPGGKDIGCAVYIDRQLAGPQGRYEGYYMMGPFQPGTKQQGLQSPITPAQQYRTALAASSDSLLPPTTESLRLAHLPGAPCRRYGGATQTAASSPRTSPAKNATSSDSHQAELWRPRGGRGRVADARGRANYF